MADVQAIEHVVLFQVKEGADPEAVAAWLEGLLALSAIDVVLHLAAGPIHRCRGPFNFTHLLHCRFLSTSDLALYSLHPAHLSLIDRDNLPLSPSSALRITLARRRQSLHPLRLLPDVTFGDNFSPARASGFSAASLAVFSGVEALTASDAVWSSLSEDVIVVDFVV
ncbi:stress-response A/B barrel domain-containing protein UP3-like [Wolffia australiana]